MSAVLGIVSMLLLLFQLLLIARAVVDWTAALAGPPGSGSVRRQLSNGLRVVTEPVLGRVRRVVPPLRLGTVSMDTAFIVVFIGIIVLRQIIAYL